MARLTKKEVLHVATLAKLKLSDSEVEKYSKQLSGVIDYIGELNEVETSNVAPTNQTTGLENVFRTDDPSTRDSLSANDAISGSESVHNGYFRVGAILSEKSEK